MAEAHPRDPRGGNPMSNLTEHNVLVFSQKAKLIELTNEYKIHTADGVEIGAVRQEGQTKLKKAARLLTNLDQFMTHTLAVYDADESKVLELVRPRKVFKSRLQVKEGSGRDVGEIVQKNVFGKIRFDLQGAGGQELGQIQAQNWRAWNFKIVDGAGREVATINKKWAGLGKEIFTTADNYAVEIEPSVTGDLRLLVLASAAGIDTALKQDDKN
jgi:uncharacterized protein YxjI